MVDTSKAFLHQIWFDLGRGASLPQHFQSQVERMRSINPNMIHRLWDLPSARELIGARMGAPWLTFFDNLPIGIQKCDFFRYVLMYELGGVYADLDFYAIVPFEDVDWAQYGQDIVLAEEWPDSRQATNTLHNGILISRKAKLNSWLSLMIMIFEEVGRRSVPKNKLDQQSYVYDTTGTRIICRWAETLSDANRAIVPFYHFCSYMQDGHLVLRCDRLDTAKNMSIVPHQLAVALAEEKRNELERHGVCCLLVFFPSTWK